MICWRRIGHIDPVRYLPPLVWMTQMGSERMFQLPNSIQLFHYCEQFFIFLVFLQQLQLQQLWLQQLWLQQL